MTPPRFTIDVGNSSVGVGAWEDGRLTVRRESSVERAATHICGEAVVISVAPARLASLLAALGPERAAGVRPLTVAPADLGAAQLLGSAGADRIANALAMRPGPGIAVDAGTAVTVDAVDRDGRFLGGFIAPGPAVAAEGLARSTAQLPLLPGTPVPLELGADTHAAMGAGLWGVAVGGVDRLVDVALAALGGECIRLVATGSWGAAWAAASRHAAIELDRDLVHRGIARWAGWE